MAFPTSNAILPVNNYFETRRNQFHRNTITRIWRTNPFRNLVKMSEFPMDEGLQPTVITFTGDLPTSYSQANSGPANFLAGTAGSTGQQNVDTAITEQTQATIGSLTQTTGVDGVQSQAVGVDPNSGAVSNPFCNPLPTIINNGRIERTFQLAGTAFATPIFCLSDLKRDWQAAEQAANHEKILKQYITTWWSDYYRVQNVAMADNKFCTQNASYATIDIVPGTVDWTLCSGIPTQQLSWTHLDQVYMDLVRRGVAEEYAVGTDSQGAPVIPIVLGVGYIQKLFRDDGSGTVNTPYDAIKYFDPKSLLKQMGLTMAKKGWLPIADVYPVRIGNATPITTVAGLTWANAIYPTLNNGSSTFGSRAIPNPSWLATSRGGIAQFEVATVLPNNVYETLYEPVDPTSFAGFKFDPVEYVGEFKWVNNKTFGGDNDLGNMGYYRADIRVAAKPLNPDLAVSILTLALSV